MASRRAHSPAHSLPGKAPCHTPYLLSYRSGAYDNTSPLARDGLNRYTLRTIKKRADERTRTAFLVSLRVSLFPTPNSAKNGCFVGTYNSELSVGYEQISLNIGPTADNC
jgi:hypothetical protein